jgi:hypothetical protein
MMKVCVDLRKSVASVLFGFLTQMKRMATDDHGSHPPLRAQDMQLSRLSPFSRSKKYKLIGYELPYIPSLPWLKINVSGY